jgi:hypothetical protein
MFASDLICCNGVQRLTDPEVKSISYPGPRWRVDVSASETASGSGCFWGCWDRRGFRYAEEDECSGRAGRGAQTRSVSRRQVQGSEIVNAKEGLLLGMQQCAFYYGTEGQLGQGLRRRVRGVPSKPSVLEEVVAAQAREAATTKGSKNKHATLRFRHPIRSSPGQSHATAAKMPTEGEGVFSAELQRMPLLSHRTGACPPHQFQEKLHKCMGYCQGHRQGY